MPVVFAIVAFLVLAVGVIALSPSADENAAEASHIEAWGATRYVHVNVNIRAGRSVQSRIVGGMVPGTGYLTDFCEANWCAVFAAEAAADARDEARRLGYAAAWLLHEEPEEINVYDASLVIRQPERQAERSIPAGPARRLADLEPAARFAGRGKPAVTPVSPATRHAVKGAGCACNG